MFLTNNNLQNLINNSTDGMKLSIYIPTHPVSNSQSILQDKTRFKNALKILKSDIRYDTRELGETIGKLEKLQDDVVFWKHQSLGLAIFADKDGYEFFKLTHQVTEIQHIADRFIVSPLIIMLNLSTEYYVLDINLTKPRLLHFSDLDREEIAIPTMPGAFEQALGYDESLKQLQHPSGDDSLFHGHSEDESLLPDIIRYFKLIAGSVDNYLINHDHPLIMTGTQNRISHMRPLLSYGNVLDIYWEGNKENLNEQQIYDATVSIVNDANELKRNNLIDLVLKADPARVLKNKPAIESAIQDGRVEKLFLPCYVKMSENIAGKDKVLDVLQLPNNIETIETLVRGVVSHKGTVVAIKIGLFDDNKIRALCRY